MRPDTFLQTLFFLVLCKDCFKWKLIAMFNFDTYNWVARTLLFVWTISIQYSQGQFGTWIIVQINYIWMQPDNILWTLFYKHSSFWFFARTVLNENWWLYSILSHRIGLQGHFHMIKQSAFNIRKDSLAHKLVQLNYF